MFIFSQTCDNNCTYYIFFFSPLVSLTNVMHLLANKGTFQLFFINSDSYLQIEFTHNDHSMAMRYSSFSTIPLRITVLKKCVLDILQASFTYNKQFKHQCNLALQRRNLVAHEIWEAQKLEPKGIKTTLRSSVTRATNSSLLPCPFFAYPSLLSSCLWVALFFPNRMSTFLSSD